MDRVDCVIIGAGVIGLACAYELAKSGLEVIILEAEESFGMSTSSRHSEVIHAGIYYPHGTNKAKWCVAGKQKLYSYCRKHDLPFKQIGKLIVATKPEELHVLKSIQQKAIHNGVMDLEILSATECTEKEPEIQAAGGIFSPSTGIIDSHAYMLSLLGEVEKYGGMLAVNSQLLRGQILQNGILLEVKTDSGLMNLITTKLINATGLHASEISSNIAGIPAEKIPRTYYRKGNYFILSGHSPFKHLVYPMPIAGGLGIHSTLDLSGQTRFGPDVEWIEKIDYTVDESRKTKFTLAIKTYWPSVQEKLLQVGYAGIRPTLANKHEGFKDFCLQVHEVNKNKVIGLYGIESPGLTSSLAIAEAVYNKLVGNN